MNRQIPFIGRDKELTQIDRLIRGSLTQCIICIDGDGGIGKTRLLQDVVDRYMAETSLIVANIIDFDNRALHDPENMERMIAKSLGETEFGPYLRGLVDYHKMEAAGVSDERLTRER